MLAYSQPITPAPTTVSVLGMALIVKIESEFRMRSPSNAISPTCATSLPVAITIVSAETVRVPYPSASSMRTVCGSTKEAAP